MFDWQTEDDVNWDDEPEVQQAADSEKRKRRWPWGLLVVVLLMSATAVTVWQQVQNRVDESTDQIEADVLASVQVIQQAAQTQDIDLFKTFLSGRSTIWASAQEQAVQSGQFVDRQLFGLYWQANSSVENAFVSLSPNLTSAEVQIPQTYRIDVGNGISETVVLTQTAVYRQGPNRWLLSPPESDFWGDTELHRGSVVHIEYPQRDSEVMSRIGPDLDLLLQDLCNRVQGSSRCPETGKIRLTLSNTSANINELSILPFPTTSTYGLQISGLPTPSVLGLPSNEAGYKVLTNAYANIVAVAMIDKSMPDDCCADDLFYQAARTMQLVQLGIRPYPFVAPREDLLDFSQIAPYWRVPNVGISREQFHAMDVVPQFVRFLVEDQRLIEPVALMENIVNGRILPFEVWLETVLNEQETVAELERAWLAYQYELTAVSQTPPPIPLPEQDIQLLCHNDQNQMELYRYELESDTLILEGNIGAVVPLMKSLPDDSGVVIGMRTPNVDEARLFFWVDGVQTSINWPKTTETPEGFPIKFDPSGRFLLLGGEGQVGGVMDFNACLNGGVCSFDTTNGNVLWSPDSEKTIVSASASGNGTFFDPNGTFSYAELGDALGQSDLEKSERLETIIGEIKSPFWMADGRMGWIAGDSNVFEHTIMLSDGDEIMPEPVLVFNQLEPWYPGELTMQNSRLNWVQAHPLNEQTLLMSTAVSRTDRETALLIAYDLNTDTGTILGVFNNEEGLNLRLDTFSPNGRFGLMQYEDSANIRQLLVYNLENKTAQRIANINVHPFGVQFFIDWSQDAEWLITMHEHYVRLTAPAHNYEHLLFFESASCYSAVWINK